jgi:excisionase family DNA binding protein
VTTRGGSILERHYTTAQVADLLAVNPETVRRAAARGDLLSRRIGRDRRYSESAVRDWLESLSDPPRAA